MPESEFDYVIVGAGTAAGIIAYRLGEAGHSVCVLEAGPSDNHPYLRVPAGFNKTLFDPKLSWQFKSEPGDGVAGRSIPMSQGRVLGGSSSINGMIYNRGMPSDYDAWVQAGNPGWSFDDLLPLFQRTERRLTQDGSADPAFRGDKGRLTVIDAKWPNALEDAFVESAIACGVPRNPDYNAATFEGAGKYQSAIHRGWRVSTSTAFLKPAAKRFRVEIRTHSQASRVLFDGKRATGVAYRRKGMEHTVRARREVILAAGALNSPKLLQLSGIGPGALLSGLGIPVLHDLPGVGENLRDHFGPRIVARAKPGVDSFNLHVTGLSLVRQVIRWGLGLSSVLATSPGRAYAFCKSDRALDTTDYTIMYAPASFKAGLVGVLDDFPGMSIGVWPQRPRSSGYVRIASADPQDAPRFDPRYLTDDADMRILLTGVRTTRRIMATEPLAGLIESELFPGLDCQSDEELTAFLRQFSTTSYHLSGSCKMGPQSDAGAVVDPRLRVHGVEGLRVADASIMPMIVSANTAVPAMVIGEKCADLVLEDRGTTR
jgi:choline dehydrogenase